MMIEIPPVFDVGGIIELPPLSHDAAMVDNGAADRVSTHREALHGDGVPPVEYYGCDEGQQHDADRGNNGGDKDEWLREGQEPAGPERKRKARGGGGCPRASITQAQARRTYSISCVHPGHHLCLVLVGSSCHF